MTRDEFLDAVRVLEEGRSAHSLYVFEDAKDAMKPIARYHWRQVGVSVFFLLLGGFAASELLPAWPWFAAYFTLAMAGAFVSLAVITLPPLRFLFVPAGFRAGDVSRAAYHVLA